MANYTPGSIDVRGSFTGEFGLGDGLPIEEAPYVIERDRINEGKLPGFNRKLLPIQVDPDSGKRTAGGYYLLDTPEQARYMFDWYQDPVNGFVLDGIPILQRSYFIRPAAHYWQVAGAHDFRAIESEQKIVRFQRWRCERAIVESLALKEWEEVREEANAAGLASVWLLFNPDQEESLGLISVAGHSATATSDQPDFTGIQKMESGIDLGKRFDDSKRSSRSFDRSSLIFSIWFPYDRGPDSKATLWPNSPPFPGL